MTSNSIVSANSNLTPTMTWVGPAANDTSITPATALNNTTIAISSLEAPSSIQYPFVDVKQFLHVALPTYNISPLLDRFVYTIIEQSEEQTRLAIEFFEEHYNRIENDKDIRKPIDILALLKANPKWAPLLELYEKIKTLVSQDRFKNGFVAKESFDVGAKDTYRSTDEDEDFETSVWKKYQNLLGGEKSVLGAQLETAYQHSAQLATLTDILKALTQHFKSVKEYINLDTTTGRGIARMQYQVKRMSAMIQNFLSDFLECLHISDQKPFRTNRMVFLSHLSEAEDMLRFIKIVDAAEKSKDIPLNQKLSLAQKTLMELVQKLDTIVFSITDVDTLSEALDPLIEFLPKKASDLQLVSSTATGVPSATEPKSNSTALSAPPEKVSIFNMDFEDVEDGAPSETAALVTDNSELANLPPPEAIPNLIMEHLESMGLTKDKFIECKKSCQFLRDNPLMVAIIGAAEREISEFHRKKHILLKDPVKVLEQFLTSYRVYSCLKSYLPAKVPCGIGIAEYDTQLGMQWRAYTDPEGDVVGFTSQTKDSSRMISRPLPPTHPLPKRVFDMAMTYLNEMPKSNGLTRLDYAIPGRVIKPQVGNLFKAKEVRDLVIDYLGFNLAVAIEMGITVNEKMPYVRIIELNPAYCGELASSFSISWDKLKKLNEENQKRKAGEDKQVIVAVDNYTAGAVWGESSAKLNVNELEASLKMGS